MKSANNYNFAMVPQVEIQRSIFDRSHQYKTTFDAAYLIPFYLDEAMPGDTFHMNCQVFARLISPLKQPIMDNMHIDMFFFSVPMRLVWENWQKFMGEKDNPDDVNTHTALPIITPPTGGWAEHTLADYLGVPINVQFGTNTTINALPFRVYNKIFKDWFRHEKLTDSPALDLDDGPDSYTNYYLRKRCKRPDYFTAALPSPQEGDAIEIPLASNIAVIGNGSALGLSNYRTGNDLRLTGLQMGNATGTQYMGSSEEMYGAALPSSPGGVSYSTVDYGLGVTNDPDHSGLIVDGSATMATINSLRQAFQLQRMKERDMRSGSRYIEQIKAHFGVTCPDFRLMRAEYLGGGGGIVNITQVAQTSKNDGTDYKASLGAFGTITGKGGFSHSFVEHCYVMGIVNVWSDQSYQQGLPKIFSRTTKYDFPWPSLMHLGEEPVYTREIYCDDSANDSTVIGYQERYAVYRYFPNQITGQLRSQFAQSLDVWHLAEEFSAAPELNTVFIEMENASIDRVIQVPSGPQIIFDSFMTLKCVRPMPVYSFPGMIDHF